MLVSSVRWVSRNFRVTSSSGVLGVSSDFGVLGVSSSSGVLRVSSSSEVLVVSSSSALNWFLGRKGVVFLAASGF